MDNRITDTPTPNQDNILNGICPNCGEYLHYNPQSNINIGTDLKTVKVVYNCHNCDNSYTIYYKTTYAIRQSVESDLIQW